MIGGGAIGDLSFVTWLIILIIVFSAGAFFIGEGFDGIALKPAVIASGNEIWTLITYMLVNYNFFHLVLNIALLFSFGALTEKIIGRGRFIVFFLAAGVLSGGIGTVLSLYSGVEFFKSDIILGASGAIFAVAGVFIMLLNRLKFSLFLIPTLTLPSLFIAPFAIAVIWIVFEALGIPAGNGVQISGLLIGIVYGLLLKGKYESKIQLLHSSFKEMEKADIARFPSEDPSPILRISRDGTIIYSNSSGDSLMKKWGTRVGCMAPQDIRQSVSEVLKSNRAKFNEVEDEGKYFLMTFVPIIASDYANLYGRDITALKEAQAKLRERNVELASLASHDMRTPLTSIISLTPLLLQEKTGKLTDKQKEMLDIIYHDALRLDTIIRNMVDASRIDEGVAVFQFKKFNLKEMVDGAIKTVYVMAKEKNVEVKSEIKKDFIMAADRERLEQVISNLIINALKYGYQGGNIWVSVKREESSIILSVKDNGQGIQKENLENIFTKDFRVQKASKRAIGGLGYGLYISRKIIEAHGGKIWVESENGKGAVFYIKIQSNIKESVKEEENAALAGKKEG